MEILYNIIKTQSGNFIGKCRNIEVMVEGKSLDEVINKLTEAIKVYIKNKGDKNDS